MHMKWTAVAGLAVLGWAATLAAAEPDLTTIRTPSPRGPLYSAANWWARFGEPVNHEAVAAAPVATPVEPAAHHHGLGYVYGPGSCDYSVPCTGWQWADYNPMPWRCNPHFGSHRGHCGGCGHCDQCGHGRRHKHGDCGCAAPAPDCAVKAPACEAVPTCEAAPACGCEAKESCCGRRYHWHWKGMGFWNKHCGCDTCAPSCGFDSKAAEFPAADEAPPKPLAEEPNRAAAHFRPALAWPFGPVR
jgi:hypothetical protein